MTTRPRIRLRGAHLLLWIGLLQGPACGDESDDQRRIVPSEDIGSPCNHASVVAPQTTPYASIPAGSCDSLMCAFAESPIAPSGGCQSDEDCFVDGEQKFECVIPEGDPEGECRLALPYVLDNSYCASDCRNDDDCVRVVDDTACESGFVCGRIEANTCCRKLCVCADDYEPDQEFDASCADGTAPGCCVEEGEVVVPTPVGCGEE